MDFGWLLGPSWTDFGSQDGAKLAPKSVQEGVKTDVKKLIKFLIEKGRPRAPERIEKGGGGSL